MASEKRHKLNCSLRMDHYERLKKLYDEKDESMGSNIDIALDYYRANPPGTIETKVAELKQNLKQELKEELYKEIIEFLIKTNK